MNLRLLRHTTILTAIPLLTLLVSARVWGLDLRLQIPVLLLGSLLHVAVLHHCVQDLQPLLHPTMEMMHALHAQHIPMAYEPDRFRWDVKFLQVFLWVGVPAPFLFLVARLWPWFFPDCATICSLSVGWTVTAFLSLLGGLLSLGLWARFTQAHVIASTPGENRRYLLRGFAEELDRPGGYQACQTALTACQRG